MSDIQDLYYSADGDFFEEYTSTVWPSRDRAPRAEAEEADDDE